MKYTNRNPSASSAAELNDFCVCRVLEDCALVKIESLNQLRAAKQYMRRVAAVVPGSYLVFSYRSKRILSKLVSHAARKNFAVCEARLTSSGVLKNTSARAEEPTAR